MLTRDERNEREERDSGDRPRERCVEPTVLDRFSRLRGGS
jgi:hypothetical protein